MSKPKKLPAARIAKWAREAQGNLAAIEAAAPNISAANDWMDDALKGVDYDQIRRGGNDSTGPERAALTNREDDIATNARRFRDLMLKVTAGAERLRDQSYELRELADKLMVDWSQADKRAAAEFVARQANAPGASSDHCRNCQRVVAGTPADRLRGGRCQECYRYYQRHNGTERPRELWAGQCAATRWAAGVDYECSLPAGHAQQDDTDHEWQPVEGVA